MTYNTSRSGNQGTVRRLTRKTLRKLKAKSLDLRKAVIHLRRARDDYTKVAFVVGCPRSGTDLVAVKLGESNDVRLVNEDDEAAFERWRLRPLEDLRRVVKESRAPAVVFKPIQETYRVVELLDAFPGSKAIFVSRRYEDTINSIVRFFGPRNVVERWVRTDFSAMAGWPVPEATKDFIREVERDGVTVEDSAAVRWLVWNRAFESLGLDADERVLLTFYEDLVAKPEQGLRRLCAHVDVSFHPRMKKGIFQSSVQSRPMPGIRPDLEERCRDLWAELRMPSASEARAG